MNDDGSIMSSFIVDADVFAILSRAEGDAGKIHPFVVKNGVVYINKAMMDSAEIAEVIAKYIRTDYLEGTEIVSPWIHSKAAPYTFELRDDGTLIAKKANITGTINATSGTFTGEVQASTGRFNNCIISESCTILGKVNAQNIDGDITQTYTLSTEGNGISIPSADFDRVLAIPTIAVTGGSRSGTDSQGDISVSRNCNIYINDYEYPVVSISASGYGACNVTSYTRNIPKGSTLTIRMTSSYGGQSAAKSVTMFVFKQ